MRRGGRACVVNAVVNSSTRASMASAGGVSLLSEMRRVASTAATASLPLSHASTAGRSSRRDSAREIKRLARDAAAHRAMLIVGRFFTGRRARQRTACLGTSGLALLSSASILNRFLAVILIASARQRRVNYTLPWSRVARVISC